MGRLRANLQATFPEDWSRFCIDKRDDERILAEICNKPALDKLLPTQAALKASLSSLESAIAKIKAEPINKKDQKAIEDLIVESRKMLGVRAASTVTLVKVPQGQSG